MLAILNLDIKKLNISHYETTKDSTEKLEEELLLIQNQEQLKIEKIAKYS
ncbi:hypothetical protein [Mycoplasmopsis felis]